MIDPKKLIERLGWQQGEKGHPVKEATPGVWLNYLEREPGRGAVAIVDKRTRSTQVIILPVGVASYADIDRIERLLTGAN